MYINCLRSIWYAFRYQTTEDRRETERRFVSFAEKKGKKTCVGSSVAFRQRPEPTPSDGAQQGARAASSRRLPSSHPAGRRSDDTKTGRTMLAGFSSSPRGKKSAGRKTLATRSSAVSDAKDIVRADEDDGRVSRTEGSLAAVNVEALKIAADELAKVRLVQGPVAFRVDVDARTSRHPGGSHAPKSQKRLFSFLGF